MTDVLERIWKEVAVLYWHLTRGTQDLNEAPHKYDAQAGYFKMLSLHGLHTLE